MTVRTKLAWQYFIAAIILFAVGYGVAYASDTFGGSGGTAKRPATAKPAASDKPVAPGKAGQSGSGQPAANQSKEGESYTVQPGDTISTIAGAKGIGVEELAEYNDIGFPYTITAGQTVKIPPKR